MKDKLFYLSWRLFAVLICIAAIIVVLTYSIRYESSLCLGIPVKSEDQLSDYKYTDITDADALILFEGEPCAIDAQTSTVYISQEIRPDTGMHDLSGKLTTANSEYELFFKESSDFESLASAVENGNSFTLVLADSQMQAKKYNVIFTTLPVINLTGDFSYTNIVDRPVNFGRVCIWSPFDPQLGRPSVKTSALEWNVRGATSADYPKKPWKLSLKSDSAEQNRDLSLLGLGEDDDWILNPMNTDDTDVREKLMMTVWNELAAETDHNYPMTVGEYVEVVINGTYNGLYHLQRRIDRKYLSLDRSSIIMKGSYNTTAEFPREAYEIIYTPLSDEETFDTLSDIGMPVGQDIMNMDNYVDVSLLIQLGALRDNKGFKNTYYVIDRTDDPRLSLVLWDTDLSFGINYIYSFTYDYNTMINMICNRCESSYISQLYPDIDTMMAERWFELREELFTKEKLYGIIDENLEILKLSGAENRDVALWGHAHGDRDTVESMKKFIEERFEFLDDYYGENLEN
ncbi:MAG: CotH kinase family protein [Clostridia bacterium]|nr:CotH kinase family protein [Clostridia bacterium]